VWWRAVCTMCDGTHTASEVRCVPLQPAVVAALRTAATRFDRVGKLLAAPSAVASAGACCVSVCVRTVRVRVRAHHALDL
jgi:hypothetical protein